MKEEIQKIMATNAARDINRKDWQQIKIVMTKDTVTALYADKDLRG